MATFLKREETRRIAAEQELKQERAQNEHIREVVNSLSKSAAVAEKVESLSGLSDPQAIDQYWRELVDSRSVVKEIEKNLTRQGASRKPRQYRRTARQRHRCRQGHS